MFGSIDMDSVISEPCYKGTGLQRNYRKMTISWSFSYNSSVKFHGEKNWKTKHTDSVTSKPHVRMRCVIKGIHCIWKF